MRFLRQAALLLPSAFLVGILLFLVTHGRSDPGYGVYPFFEDWTDFALVPASPEGRFVAQAFVFFLPAYVATLLFVLLVAVAERAVLGMPEPAPSTTYRQALGATFSVLFLLATALVVWYGDRLAARNVPGALVAPVLVAAAPWAGAAAALPLALLLAGPVAYLRKASFA